MGGLAMHREFKGETLLRYLAVAVMYALAVSLFRQLSISHWMILGGLYLTVLLLVPYRYWVALTLGEIASLGHLSYACTNELGVTWAMFNLIPAMLLIAPIAYWARERGRLFSNQQQVNIGTLLLSALLMSGIMTLRSLGMMTITQLPVGYPPIDYGQLAARWMLGDYLGMLTITPLAVLLYQAFVQSTWGGLRRKLAESPLAMECLYVLLPSLGFLVWISLNAAPDTQTRQAAQIAMFLPIVWLALRHGWHGAAIGGSAASLAIFLLMPHRYNSGTIQAEIVIAFVMSTMLLMGARIAVLDRRARTEHTDLQLALSLAQRNVEMGETQLRMTSQTLEQIGLAVHSVYMTMTNRLHLPHTPVDDRNYQNMALHAKDQLFGLADSLYPAAWQEKGLASALREGQIPRSLDQAGIRYWCDLRCRTNCLSSGLQLSLYRLVCDAIAEACSKRSVTEIGVHLRSGEHDGRRWVVLRLSFRADPIILASVQWSQLLSQLIPAGSARGFQAIEDRAATFGGRARERALQNGRRISVLLLDPETPSEIIVH